MWNREIEITIRFVHPAHVAPGLISGRLVTVRHELLSAVHGLVGSVGVRLSGVQERLLVLDEGNLCVMIVHGISIEGSEAR